VKKLLILEKRKVPAFSDHSARPCIRVSTNTSSSSAQRRSITIGMRCTRRNSCKRTYCIAIIAAEWKLNTTRWDCGKLSRYLPLFQVEIRDETRGLACVATDAANSKEQKSYSDEFVKDSCAGRAFDLESFLVHWPLLPLIHIDIDIRPSRHAATERACALVHIPVMTMLFIRDRKYL